MKVLLVLALIAAAIWLWRNHTTTSTQVCRPQPVGACINRPTTTTPRKA